MASLGDLVRARQATASTDEPPELLKRPPEEPAPPPKQTLGDLVRARQAAAAQPGATGGAALGDVFRRDKERAETPELLRRPEPAGPEPSDESPDEPPELLKRPAYEEAPPGAYGKPTGLEQVGLTAARIGVPTVAGMAAGALSGPGAPVVGPLVGASAATATELGLEKYEKARGLRKDVSPYGVMWQGVLGGFPGIPLGEELTLPARIAARTAEGTGVGTLATTGQTLAEEGRLPTKREVATGAVTGALFGAGGGTVEAKGVPWLHERSAEFVGPRPEGELSWRQQRAAKKYATSAEQLAGETTLPPVGEPQRMVTKPDETIGPGSEFVGPPEPEMTPHPVGSDVLFREIGQQERTTPGKIIAHEVNPETGEPRIMVGTDDGFVRGRPMDDVELAPTRGDEFVGPPEPPEFVGPPEPTVPPPPGGGAPPPEGPPGETPPPGGEYAGTTPPSEPEGPWGRRPTFRRYPGLGEALTDEEIAAQRHADPERVTRALESVDREFGSVLDDESRARLKQQIVDNQERFEYLGRGKQTMERTRGLARDYLVDLDAAKLEPKGTTYNAEQTQAMKNHIAGLDLAIQDAQKAFEADPTPEHGLILQKAAQDQIDAFNIFRARGAEAGRTINIYKGTAEELASGNQRLLMAALRRGVPPEKLVEILKTTKPEDVMARAEMLEAATDRGGLWKRSRNLLKTIFISDILSGPGPHERNTLGNSVRAYLATPAAELFGAAHERLAGVPEGERLVRAGEAAKHYIGMRDAFPDAINKTAEILKRGYTQEQAATYDLPLNEAFIGAHPLVRGAVNAVPRALGGMDMFFRVQGQEGSLYSQAWTRGMNEALVERAAGKLPQGMTFDQRVEQLYRHYQANPTPEMMTQAAEEATRGVYQERDKIARAVTFLRDQIPFGDFILPFVTTSTNLAKQGLHWTPAGYLMPSTRGKVEGISPRTVVLHKGEALGGTIGMLLGPLALYAMGGKVHGSGPSDWDERQEWLNTHTPNSIELLGVNVGFNWMGPLAVPLAAIGNAWDKYDEIKQKRGYIAPQDMDDIAQEVIYGTAESVLDQPYLQGLSNFINMVTHPRDARYRNKFVKDIATGFIPGSGLLRWAEQVDDPTIRQSRTLGEKAMGGIPGLSASVPPKLDAFGNPIQVRTIGGPWGRAAFPFPVEYSKHDPVRDELTKQGVQLSPPSSIKVAPGEAPLTPQEDLAIKRAKGGQVRQEIEDLFASSAYQDAEPEMQKKMLKGIVGRTRAAIGKRAQGMRGEGFDRESLRF